MLNGEIFVTSEPSVAQIIMGETRDQSGVGGGRGGGHSYSTRPHCIEPETSMPNQFQEVTALKSLPLSMRLHLFCGNVDIKVGDSNRIL
jgi:hypothetical protein